MRSSVHSLRSQNSRISGPQNNRYALDPSDIELIGPSPANPANIVDQDFLDLQKIADDDLSNWDKVISSDGVTIYKKMADDSPVVLLKVYAMIDDYSPETILEVLNNAKVRQSWDKVLCNFELIEDFTDHQVIYFMIKTPIGISNRDFLQQRKTKYDFPLPGLISMHFKSVQHPRCPDKPKIVRGDTVISGYILERYNNAKGRESTKLTIITQNDIKGLVPKSIVNMAASKAPKQWVTNLITGCEEYLKTK